MATAKRQQKNRSTLIQSMTGFGRAGGEDSKVSIDVELRSVNHRYLDIGFKLPRQYSGFEAELKSELSSKLNRGRIEVWVGRREKTPTRALNLNAALFDRYLDIFKSILVRQKVPLKQIDAQILFNLMNREGVLEQGEQAGVEKGEEQLLSRVFNEALSDLVSMRTLEGKRLTEDMLTRLQSLENLKVKIQKSSANTPKAYRQRLEQRLKKLASDLTVSEERLAQEIALLSERVDITEELTRLDSHFLHYRSILEENTPGKKLDFLLQEFNREFNTISSKALDSAVQSLVVEAKSEIDKLKEQVQNIE